MDWIFRMGVARCGEETSACLIRMVVSYVFLGCRGFGLESDHGLSRLGTMVHALDICGISVPEASGFEAVLAGARARLKDDDALLAEIGTVAGFTLRALLGQQEDLISIFNPP